MREGGCGRVGEREERTWGGGGGKGGGSCVLAVARDVKRAADKKVAAARFPHKRYC